MDPGNLTIEIPSNAVHIKSQVQKVEEQLASYAPFDLLVHSVILEINCCFLDSGYK